MSESRLEDDDLPPAGSPLTKDQRRDLLAQIERAASRSEPPEALLERADQELRAGRLDAAKRLLAYLEARSPELRGLATLHQRLHAAEANAKHIANVRKAEEMLLRYIQERKKALAKLALDALLELVPEHPRKGDYTIWIADLDQEMAMQKRIDAERDAGRTALHAGDFAGARRRLDALRKLAPDAPATEQLARELEELERGQAESATIGRHRQRVEELIGRLELEAAERELQVLSRLSVPKVTLDFLRKRVEDAKGQMLEASHLQNFETAFREHLQAGRWQAARDVAHEVGSRFRGHPRSPEMFDEVTRREAEARRRQSLEQGIRALEGYIANRQRREAELALRVLQGLEPDAQRLAVYEAKIRQL